MSFTTERQLIESDLDSFWTATTIAFPNVQFTPVSGTAFIRLTVFNANSDLLEFTNDGAKLYTGLIMVGIFTPVNTGSKLARSYADMLVDHYEGLTLSNIHFDASSELIEAGEDDGWYHMSFQCGFWRFE